MRPGRKRGPPRVLGPYHDTDHDRWRLVLVDIEGKRRQLSFAGPKEAFVRAGELRAEYERLPRRGDVSIDRAVDEYELYMREVKGNKTHSAYVTGRRLRDFFPKFDLPLRLVDEPLCNESYKRLVGQVAVATHQNTLSQVKTFLKWCIAQRYLAANPAEHIMPEGKPSYGKPQLRLDEARRWQARALWYAERGRSARWRR